MKRALRRKRRELAEERGAYLFQTLFRGHKGREAAEIERELKQLDLKARPLYHLIAAHTDELNRIETSLEGTDKRIACYLEEMEEAELELNSLTMSNAKYSDSARINSTPQRFVTKYLRVRLKDHILQIAEKARMEQELQRASKEKTNDLARRIRMARRELVPLTLGCISKVKQERGRRLRAYVRSRDKSVVLLQAVVRAYAARKGYRDPARNYWILCSDQTLSGIPYYYNTQTQESSWNAPFIFKFALSAVSAPCHLLTTDASYMEEEEQEEEDFSEDADSSWSGDESTILEGDESCSEDNNANYK